MKRAEYCLDTELKMARLWQQKGKLERAIAGYQKVLECQPSNAEIHKQHINLLAEVGGMTAAFAHYDLIRKDNRALEVGSSDILCCVSVRNEALRLPYFLQYYRERGISKFFLVDNHSTDDTLPFLLTQPDVYVWQSRRSFLQANFGSVWFELLLRTYGVGHWCLIVDADELFYYPDCETKPLQQICRELDNYGYTAYPAILLDMYADGAIKDTSYQVGEDFRTACPYFDRKFYHRIYKEATPYQNQTVYVGGLRERVFGKAGDYYLTKIALLKYEKDCVLAGGQHWTNYPAYEIAKGRGALLHFKYLANFWAYVQKEVIRKEHYAEAMQYVQYAQGFAADPNLAFYSDQHSLKLDDSEQLVRLGIVQREPAASDLYRAVFPVIGPVTEGNRPLWSVMITCHRPTYLAQTLKSVLMQATAPSEMQIEVVVDGVEASLQAEIVALVREIGGDRVQVYTHPTRINQPYIFNLAIERARGHWVHILHDDDWLLPGFYQAFQAVTESNAETGAAFCRHRYMRNGEQRRISRLERPTPGLIENWLEKIVTFCHIQFSAVVVKRSVYEQMGGFCPRANTIADWEMWKRIAAHYPVWYEPAALMNYREHAESETSHLLRSGQQVAETRRTIFISRRYLPRAIAPQLSRTALENYAFYALDIAKQQLQRQDSEAAIANVKEALKCSDSASVQQALVKLFLPIEERHDSEI
ncbi:MAG: glycosyltransferase family 2 protein [Cyanobacteria bacterium J06631_12]